MADSYRTMFGDTRCKLGVHTASEGTFVAWALETRSGGHLLPVHDKQGTLILVRGVSAPSVLAEVRTRVSARFGGEQAATDNPDCRAR